MFFLIKSAFWLAIVFYCMTWPGGERPEATARQAAGELATHAQAAVVAGASSACAAAPLQCLAAANDAVAHATAPKKQQRGRSAN